MHKKQRDKSVTRERGRFSPIMYNHLSERGEQQPKPLYNKKFKPRNALQLVHFLGLIISLRYNLFGTFMVSDL